MMRMVTITLLILLLSACTAIPTKDHNTGECTRSIVVDAIRGYRQHDRQAVIDILIAILAATPSSALHTPAHAQTEGAEQTVAAPQLTGAVNLERLAIELSWNAVTGADHYELRKLHGNVCPAWEQVGRSASTSYYDSSVRILETYSYAVRTIAADGTRSAWSNRVDVRTPLSPPLPPPPPAAPTVTVNDPNSLKVTWSAPSFPSLHNGPFQITSFDLRYRSGRSGGWTEVTGRTSSHIQNGLSPSTLYLWQARAVNGAGPGSWSGIGEGETPPSPTTTQAKQSEPGPAGQVDEEKESGKDPTEIE